jgi:uncharacterized membrane protein
MATLYDYFITPMLQNGWYNPINTITYAILLVIGVFVVFKLLRRMGLSIDRYFFLGILPFIFWGSSARVLKDAATSNALDGPAQALFASPFWVTPGSYLITFALALFVLLASLVIQRVTMRQNAPNISIGSNGTMGVAHYDFLASQSTDAGSGSPSRSASVYTDRTDRSEGFAYWKVMFSAGLVLSALNVLIMPLASIFPMLLILGITGAWALVFYLPHILPRISARLDFRRIKSIFTPVNSGILTAHLFDASATFVSLAFFGYLEQHVVPRLFIPFMGPAAMFALKLAVVIPVLYLIDRYSEPGNFRNFLKISVLILGLAPGLRDTMRLGAEV